MQYGFIFNARRCTGCKACVSACRDYHDLGCDLAYRQVYEYAGGGWVRDGGGCWTNDVFAYYVSLACNHCAEPACTMVCPTGAMHKEDDGIVCIDTDRCIGCGYCAMSCPYRAPHVDRSAGHSSKCDFCRGRVRDGLPPVCVEACPRRALEYGPFDEECSRKALTSSSVAPLPCAELTHPSLLVIPHRDMRPSGSADGHVSNLSELV